MAFTLTHRTAATFRESAIGRAVNRLRSRRTDRYLPRMPVAMVTASLGGHPRPVVSGYR